MRDDFSELMLYNDFELDGQRATIMGFHGVDFVWIEWQSDRGDYVTLEPLKELAGGKMKIYAPSKQDKPNILTLVPKDT